MSDFSLTLVLQFKTSKIINGMAKVQIKFRQKEVDAALGAARAPVVRHMVRPPEQERQGVETIGPVPAPL